jgi:glycerol kinase
LVVASSNRLLTTVAYQLDGKRTYALEAVCYQTNHLLEDGLRLDHAIPRRYSGRTGRPAHVLEITALGAAYLAGLQAGMLPKPDVFAKMWKRQKRFAPKMDAKTRAQKRAGWAEAVRKLLA